MSILQHGKIYTGVGDIQKVGVGVGGKGVGKWGIGGMGWWGERGSQQVRPGEAWEPTVRHGKVSQVKGLSALCQVMPTWGPTWGAVGTHSVGRALERSQPAPHVAEPLGEAGLLDLQQLLQLADGREDLLLVEAALGTEGPPPTMAGSLALGFQSHPDPGPNRGM